MLLYNIDIYIWAYHLIGASQAALVLENAAANARGLRDEGSIPGSGRSPEGGRGNLL